jgi:predicted ArsR family transcriptional regulator
VGSTLSVPEFAEDVSTIAALAEPLRRELYLYVRSQNRAVGRDEAAEALNIPRHNAKFHLDRLAEEGLLCVQYKRLSGLKGPGAGRPSKLYTASTREVSVSIPPRDYALAGLIMARAIDQAAARGTPIEESVATAARHFGTTLGKESPTDPATDKAASPVAQTCGILVRQGYEPMIEDGSIALLNCPFHALVAEHTQLVCSMNLAMLDGLTAETGGGELQATLQPTPGRCCVVIHRAEAGESERAETGGS